MKIKMWPEENTISIRQRFTRIIYRFTRIRHRFRFRKNTHRINSIPMVLACGLLLFNPASEGPEELAAKKKSKKTVHKTGKPRTFQTPAGVRLTIPFNYKLKSAVKKTFTGADYTLLLHSRGFAQGTAVYVEVLPHQGKFPENYRLYISHKNPGKKSPRRKVPMTRKTRGFRGFMAINPLVTPGTIKTIYVTAGPAGSEKNDSYKLKIASAGFKTFHRSMDLGKYSNRNYLKNKPKLRALIKANRIKLGAVLRRKPGPDLFQGRLSHPRKERHYVTSPFYSKRITKRYVISRGKRVYKKSRVSRHRGLDLWGRRGAPISALADGQVVIAEKFYYAGNYVLIDHGQGIYSGYMHQSKIITREGARVQAGAHIGNVGATGMVTGPHLHVTLRIRGVYVHPLSLLSLPIRD